MDVAGAACIFADSTKMLQCRGLGQNELFERGGGHESYVANSAGEDRGHVKRPSCCPHGDDSASVGLRSRPVIKCIWLMLQAEVVSAAVSPASQQNAKTQHEHRQEMRGTRASGEGEWDGFREDRDDWHGASANKDSREDTSQRLTVSLSPSESPCSKLQGVRRATTRKCTAAADSAGKLAIAEWNVRRHLHADRGICSSIEIYSCIKRTQI